MLQFYLFPTNFPIFIRKISHELFSLVIDHKFRNSSLFSLFQYISPLFPENYYFPPTLTNIPRFPKIHLLFTCFMCISFPPTFIMMHLCITQCTYWTPLLFHRPDSAPLQSAPLSMLALLIGAFINARLYDRRLIKRSPFSSAPF